MEELFRLGGGLFLVFLQLQVLLFWIALFAGFAVFMRSHAAFVRAFLASRRGFFAAGFVFVFLPGDGGAHEEGDCASNNTQYFDKFHFLFVMIVNMTEPFSNPAVLTATPPPEPLD